MFHSSRKRNEVKRPDKSVIVRLLRCASFAAVILTCLLLFEIAEVFAQRGDFLKTDHNTTTNVIDESSVIAATNATTIAPSSRDYLFDEWYQFETAFDASVDGMLSEREQHYVDGLIERGLTNIAEHYCRKRLGFDSLTGSQKAGYARALLQSQKQTLLNASSQNRAAVRLQIEQTVREIDAISADTTWSTIIALQQINIMVADIEHQQPGEIISRIDVEMQRVSQRIASQPASSTVSRETSMQISLARRLQFRKALALRLLAQDQPEQQAELLAQALAILRPLIITNISPTVSPEQVALSNLAAFEAIAVHRKLQQYGEIETLLNHLRKSDFLSPRDRAMIPAVELLLAVDLRDEAKVHAALQAIETVLADAKSSGITQQINYGVPDLMLARLQGYLFFWKRNLETQSSLPYIVGTTTAPNIVVCRTNVIGILRSFESDFAPYWRHKAESIMSTESAFFGNDPVFVEQRTDTLVRDGRIDEAIANYDSLAAALAVSDPNEAFRIARRAADLLAMTADYQWQHIDGTNKSNATTLERSLLERLKKLALSNTQHQQAAETHLAAVYHAARLMQLDAINLDAYLSLLAEHYLTWPHSKQADAIRLQAAQLLLHESKFREAVDVLTPINNRSTVAMNAVTTAEQCFDCLRLSEPSVNATIENKAVSWFYARLLIADKVIDVDWNEADWHCLLCRAKFGLLFADVIERNKASNPTVDLAATYGAIEKVLRIGSVHGQQTPPEWHVASDPMLLYLFIVQQKTDEASQLMQNMRQWDMPALVALVTRLQQQAEVSSRENRRLLGQMRLDIVQLIEQKSSTSTQNANEIRQLNIIRADALADTDNVQAAVNQLSEMLRQSPGDVEVLTALARILGRQSDVKSRELALRTWRTVEQRSPSNSESWWDAKEAIIHLLMTSGDATQRQQAKSMFEMQRILNPDLGGAERKLRFDAMFKKSD